MSQLPYLCTPQAIRERCGQLFEKAKQGQLPHFHYHPEKVDEVVDFVMQVIQKNYPDLQIPYHSRWRHFEVGNVDRMDALWKQSSAMDSMEKGRICYDLVIPSVLVDAGAGAQWSYTEASTQQTWGRSEGLGVASFYLYTQGALSSQKGNLLRTNAKALQQITRADFEQAFQVSSSNPLLGIDGRVLLLQQLGQTIEQHSNVFGGTDLRLGRLFDYFVKASSSNTLSAAFIFETVLRVFSPIWPGRLSYDGVNLGDCWKHSLIEAQQGPSDTQGYLPFHKLSQWLSYSLVEPLEDYGISVTGLDELTGLPEYRNGGLFLDLGVLSLKDAENAKKAHKPSSELIVEWRALTVALLDLIHPLVCKKLNVSSSNFPLAKLLEGGTWSAGRQCAFQRDKEGKPPLQIQSDGTVF